MTTKKQQEARNGSAATGKKQETVTLLEITASRPRRRAGMAFGPQPVQIAASKLSKAKLEALRADPVLSVKEVEIAKK